MDSYVIHIYRRVPGDPEGIIGTVEIAGVGKPHPFRNLEEVCKILMAPPGRRKRRLTSGQGRHKMGG